MSVALSVLPESVTFPEPELSVLSLELSLAESETVTELSVFVVELSLPESLIELSDSSLNESLKSTERSDSSLNEPSTEVELSVLYESLVL